MNMNRERYEKRESGKAAHFRDITKMVGRPEPNYGEFAMIKLET